MSLVSKVGRRSARVRLLFLAMYLVMFVGSVTMVYPFLLMLSMGTTGKADGAEFRIMPRYWVSDKALFKKYLVDAATIEDLVVWFNKSDWFAARDIREEDLEAVVTIPARHRRAMAKDLCRFIAAECPSEFKIPLFLQDADSPLALQTEYYDWLTARYGSIDRVNRLYPDSATSWDELGVPPEPRLRRPGNAPRTRDYRLFVQSRPPQRTGLFDADATAVLFARGYSGLKEPRPGARVTYEDIASGRCGEKAKRDYLLTRAWLRFARVDVGRARGAWKQFLSHRGGNPLAPLAARVPDDPRGGGLWAQFIQSACPLNAVSFARPEDHWRRYLAGKYQSIGSLNSAYGTDYDSFGQVRITYAVTHWDYVLSNRDHLRREYLLHNFRTVISFVTVHGHALLVTLVFIVLTMAATLTVNPLAAYAMSRFRLRETYSVLIFLLATMAFPGEVLMIPSFLMIKSFPLAQILAAGACCLLFALIQHRLKMKMSPFASATTALVVVALVAGLLVPRLASALGLRTSVSLMNTFWALILPGLANGYGIFLLKGFFDSLPPELYEAGLIDGASEMTMFWRITLPLCKPILAVLALGAFTGAYGAFMHAFLVCQDPEMWTLMVFLYEFQQNHSVPMAMAALTVAAVPTLLVFVFCQNIIMRGIVIPTYK